MMTTMEIKAAAQPQCAFWGWPDSSPHATITFKSVKKRKDTEKGGDEEEKEQEKKEDDAEEKKTVEKEKEENEDEFPISPCLY